MSAPTGSTGSAAPGRPIFVVASDNTGVHVYRDVQSVLDARPIGGGQPDSIEFFDIFGGRLVPVFSDTGELNGLRDAGDQPDEQMVQTRLGAVIQQLAASVDERLTKADNPPGNRQEALAKLPDLAGKPLPDCFVLLEPIFGHAGGVRLMNPGSWWHNFWAH